MPQRFTRGLLSVLGEHKQPEYLENINRFGRVPVIDDNGMKLTER